MIPTTTTKQLKTGVYYHNQCNKYATMNPLQLATERADINARLKQYYRTNQDALHLQATIDNIALRRFEANHAHR